MLALTLFIPGFCSPFKFQRFASSRKCSWASDLVPLAQAHMDLTIVSCSGILDSRGLLSHFVRTILPCREPTSKNVDFFKMSTEVEELPVQAKVA